MGRSKKAIQATRVAKKRRNKSNQAARLASAHVTGWDGSVVRTMELGNPFDDTAGSGYIDFAPEVTVEEFQALVGSEGVVGENEYDIVDPVLTRLLRSRREWEGCEDSTWDHVGSRRQVFDAWGEFAQPMHIAVGRDSGTPVWKVYFPTPDESRRDPGETYTSRDALVAELDRLEELGHQPVAGVSVRSE